MIWHLFTLLFVGLKLTGHVDWSWWWVLSPSLIYLLFVTVFVIYAAIQHARMMRAANPWKIRK